MTWNNRLCRDQDRYGNEFFSVREVFYDDGGNPTSWTSEPTSAVAETADDTIHMLKLQLDDCLNRPILDLVELAEAFDARRTQPQPDA